MDAAHFVEVELTPEGRKLRLKEEREAVNRRQEARLACKRKREEEHEEQLIERHEAREAVESARDWAVVYPIIARARAKTDLEQGRLTRERRADDAVAAWAAEHIKESSCQHFTLAAAYEQFKSTGMPLSKLRFSSRLQKLFVGCFHAQKKIGGIKCCGVFAHLKLV